MKIKKIMSFPVSDALFWQTFKEFPLHPPFAEDVKTLLAYILIAME